jgi:hypothetical protein
MDDERVEIGFGGGRPEGPRRLKSSTPWRPALVMAAVVAATLVVGGAKVALIACMFGS